MSKRKIVIWGSRSKNYCQEQDLREAFEKRNIPVEIWGPNSISISNDPECSKEIQEDELFLIRNFFYSYMKTYNSENEPKVIRQLRDYGERAQFLNSIDGLIQTRDKLTMDDVLRQLKIPYVKTYQLRNDPPELVKWISDTAARFSSGVIIKDRFGGRGKGILRVKKQGSLYLCDISCVDGSSQEYVNETLSRQDLTGIFAEHMGNYELIGQPYIKSSHEFRTLNESESVRVLEIGQKSHIAMKRVAESPINNLSLSKNRIINGRAQKTEATKQERQFSLSVSERLGLFLAGYDFIRTNLGFYRHDPGAVYIPKHLRGEDEISLLLEVNGIVQFGGMQELYEDEFQIADYVAGSVEACYFCT